MNSKSFFRLMMALVIMIVVGGTALAQEDINGTWEVSPSGNFLHRFGYSVAGGCDFNGDGHPDIVVGAPYFDLVGKLDAGRVYIFSGVDHRVLCILDGETANSLFGYSVACAGDVNGDGTPDFLVGAPGYNSNRGRTYVYSGSTFTLLHTFDGSAAGDQCGRSVSGVGDMNGDGKADIIIGSPGVDNGKGMTHVYHGGTWTVRCTDYGENYNDSLGISVSGPGDLNNDGTPDYIVAAPYWDGIFSNEGQVYPMSGATCNLLFPLHSFHGDQANEHYGYSVSGADVDHDGYTDFIVGAPGYNDSAGAVAVYHGSTGTIFVNGILYGEAIGDKFGFSVSKAGDVNNDGNDDFNAGAPGALSKKGKAYVYWRSGLYFSAWCIIQGNASGDNFGFSTSMAGDVSTVDGYDDVLIGAPFANTYGRAYVRSGADCSEIFKLYPVYPGITVKSPPADTCIQSNTWYTVRWDTLYTTFFPYVKLQYSLNGGNSWSSGTTIPNNGSHSCLAPDTCIDNALIKMCIDSTCLQVCDISDTFSFNKLSVISPNGGEIFCAGTQKYITWNPCCFPGNVKIVLTSDSCHIGDTVLVQSTPNSGEDSLIWPCFPSARSKIKILNPSTGYVYAQSQSGFTSYRPGDANGDCIVDVGDINYIINYLFHNGPPPCPMVSGDDNCNGYVTISDEVYLSNYLYKGGPPPLCCTSSPALETAEGFNLDKGANAASVGLSKTRIIKQDEFEINLEGKSQSDIAGMEFEISYDPHAVTLLEPVSTPRTQGLQVHSFAKDGILKMGIFDPSGRNIVSAGEGPLITLKGKGSDPGSIKIHSAILVDRDANSIPVNVIEEVNKDESLEAGSLTPKDFSLSQNLPNPFNPETRISYDLPSACQVKLCIYNLLGQKTRTLVDEYQSAGHKIINWDGKDDQGNQLASGVYFYRIQAGDFTDAMKMIMMK